MIDRKDLLQSPEYWFENAQNDLYGHVMEYLEKENINQNQFAEQLGVTKGYVSQVLKAKFNYTLKKLIELSIAVGKVPVIEYKDIKEVLHEDNQTHHLRGIVFGTATVNDLQFTNAGYNGKRFDNVNSFNQGQENSTTIGRTSVESDQTLPTLLKTA